MEFYNNFDSFRNRLMAIEHLELTFKIKIRVSGINSYFNILNVYSRNLQLEMKMQLESIKKRLPLLPVEESMEA